MSDVYLLRRVLIAAFTGFLAGVATVLLISAPPVSAKNKSVEATSFVLLDNAGKKRGEWTLDSGRPRLRMFDDQGQVVWDTEGRVYRLGE